MNLNKYLSPGEEMRFNLNIGCLMDIPTSGGRYYVGKHGESICNGGMMLVEGAGARGNMNKTTFIMFRLLRVIDRYANSNSSVYDTEMSLTTTRILTLAMNMSNIAGVDLFEEERVFITDAVQMSGNIWFDAIKKFRDDKVKDKSQRKAVPFINKHGENYTWWLPTVVLIDSFSGLPIDAVDALFDKETAGGAKLNAEAMRSAAAKTQILSQMPVLTASAGIYITMTAHLGDGVNVGGMPGQQPVRKLKGFKGDEKFKNVPERFTFYTNNLWKIDKLTILQNADKRVLYPRGPGDNLIGDTDLQLIQVFNMRAKNGPTGLPFPIVVSQSEGVKPSLTEYHYLRDKDWMRGWGMHASGGKSADGASTVYLDIYPDVALQRTTIRSLCEEDEYLQRALEITSELCQMHNLWRQEVYENPQLYCTPQELYDDLKAKGFDWDVLLNTRGYWTYLDDHNPLPFLSTMDLLRMRTGEYFPYWMDEKTKQPKNPVPALNRPSNK